MSFVIAAPEVVTDAATNLASIGSTISAGQRGGSSAYDRGCWRAVLMRCRRLLRPCFPSNVGISGAECGGRGASGHLDARSALAQTG